MNSNLIPKILCTVIVFLDASIALSQSLPKPTSAPSSPPRPPLVVTPAHPPTMAPVNIPLAKGSITNFRCVSQGNGFATLADNGKRQATLITWNTTFFGSDYTPKQRCEIVSNKLTTAVASNGGSLKNLLLSNGPFNGQMVICYLNGGKSTCDGSNQLFTLKPENARKAGTILQSLLNFGLYGTGTINESGGDQVYVNLETWAEKSLGSEVETSPMNVVNPAPQSSPSSFPDNGF